MIVIGLHGRIGAGKNHIANAFKRHSSCDSFANPLKFSVACMFGLQLGDTHTQEGKNKPSNFHWEHMSPELRNKFPDRTGPMLIREILQVFGTETMRALWGQDFWVRNMRERIEYQWSRKVQVLFISDVRYPDEAKLVREYGEVWHVIPVDMPTKALLSKDTCAAHHRHSSEQPLPKDLIDLTVYNSFRDFEATKAVLQENLDRLLKADAAK